MATSFAEGCYKCALLDAPMVSHEWGSVTCILPCDPGMAYDADTDTCVPGCDVARGLYRAVR